MNRLLVFSSIFDGCGDLEARGTEHAASYQHFKRATLVGRRHFSPVAAGDV